MNLFKKVMIIGLATMALGSAAMGDPDKQPNCASVNGLPNAQQVKAGDPAPGGDDKDGKKTTSGIVVQQ